MRQKSKDFAAGFCILANEMLSLAVAVVPRRVRSLRVQGVPPAGSCLGGNGPTVEGWLAAGKDGYPESHRIVKIAGEFLRYLVASCAAVVTHLAVLVILVQLAELPKPLASAMGFCCAIPVNYVIQHRYVFRKTGAHIYYFIRYLLITLTMMLVNVMIFWIFTSIFGIFYILSQLLTIGIIAVLNFLFNRAFTFANRPVRTAQ